MMKIYHHFCFAKSYKFSYTLFNNESENSYIDFTLFLIKNINLNL